MKTSNAGIAALVRREGIRQKAYKDTKGIWTIGVGHTGPNVYEGLAWTLQQVYDALADDLKTSEDCVNTCVTVPLTQNQFDALVSFIFNIGVTAFRRSTMLKLLNLSLFDLVTDQFDRWDKPPEIIGRRMSEKAQFNLA